MAQSEYLQREQAAKKQLGSKGVKKRVRQLPTAARATLKEMTGVDISRRGVSIDPVQLGMSVLGYTRLGSVAAKAASRALKAGDVASAKLAQAAADQFKLASKFPKSAGARTVDKKIIGEIIKQRVKTQNPGPLRVPGAMRLGMDTAGDDLYWTSKYVRTGEIEAAHRGIAKIIGKAGRADPVLREVGRDIRAVSGYRKYKGIVPKKAK